MHNIPEAIVGSPGNEMFSLPNNFSFKSSCFSLTLTGWCSALPLGQSEIFSSHAFSQNVLPRICKFSSNFSSKISSPNKVLHLTSLLSNGLMIEIDHGKHNGKHKSRDQN